MCFLEGDRLRLVLRWTLLSPQGQMRCTELTLQFLHASLPVYIAHTAVEQPRHETWESFATSQLTFFARQEVKKIDTGCDVIIKTVKVLVIAKDPPDRPIMPFSNAAKCSLLCH